MRKFIIISLIFLTSLQTYAFEELVLSTDGKINNIKIENNSILNIELLRTINNEKNILFIIPNKTGKTSFSLSKNNKIFNFNVNIDENNTEITEIEGFEIVSLDTHPTILDYEIDKPPVFKKKETINIDGAIIELDSDSEVNE